MKILKWKLKNYLNNFILYYSYIMDSLLVNLSNNKLFAGCIMLITNIGSKYLVLDMPQTIEKLFSS
jgi:hypothetical protein